ncbi:hypothetical protein [Nocardia cyriacigeorgica]|uniref:hypothetical protein n=1 Tax=Nocardia cyriacigeorgica TaxID=135487 RepID=UPI0018948900|nr:hypothetical protein [Nocardia cyriacigeorgica]MBF6456435.1 hypothetical protein [Nocardia cyriacigeorgica]MBF6479389.1 hypothetical protein [Nocardia cyriacigeorgica]MBF6551241.1 hypothetical protein [Nocardia cyriacigeorgica]
MRKTLAIFAFGTAFALGFAPSAAGADMCDFWYDEVLVPQCQEEKTRQCWEGINQWYADCKAGKVQPPMEHISGQFGQ